MRFVQPIDAETTTTSHFKSQMQLVLPSTSYVTKFDEAVVEVLQSA
ncbi:MAG: hypothetical protein GY696_39110 [Gammaproteobacteria bacterium]|nr:hypothetical protein [Gammaproteobacteria bacterium]